MLFRIHIIVGSSKRERGCVKGHALESPKPTGIYFTRDSCGKGKPNLRPLGFCAFSLDLAAMRLNNIFRDG